jgi:hypothetical protein
MSGRRTGSRAGPVIATLGKLAGTTGATLAFDLTTTA